jgi:FkbM family methyltransferase
MDRRIREVGLQDGVRVACLKKVEALTLDSHIDGYFRHGVRVREGDVIFDVGANIGLFGLRAMQRCQGRATVLAFEPIPAIFRALAENTSRFGAGLWRALPYGLSSRRTTAELHYFPASPASSTAHPEVYDDDPELFLSSVRGTLRSPPPSLWWARYLPSPIHRLIAKDLRRNREPVRCELRTISDIMVEHRVSRIDLLKVDVEGEELEVLRGIDEADWEKIGQIVVEVHDLGGRLEAVKDLLRAHGFGAPIIDKERAFDSLPFFNVYARR